MFLPFSLVLNYPRSPNVTQVSVLLAICLWFCEVCLQMFYFREEDLSGSKCCKNFITRKSCTQRLPRSFAHTQVSEPSELLIWPILKQLIDIVFVTTSFLSTIIVFLRIDFFADQYYKNHCLAHQPLYMLVCPSLPFPFLFKQCKVYLCIK